MHTGGLEEVQTDPPMGRGAHEEALDCRLET